LETRAGNLMKIPDAELKKLGEAGKDRRVEEEEEAIRQLRDKHHVQ
jgi:hypothetical protein